MNSEIFDHKPRFNHVLAAMLVVSILLITYVFIISPAALADSRSELTTEAAFAWSNSTQVNTSEGPIEGDLRDVTTLDGATVPVYTWLGIPYADNPETPEEATQMRWTAPQPPAIRSGVLQTKVRMRRCPQFPIPEAFQANGQIYDNEDCRYANVWRPKSTEHNLPVYVDIHGGGNALGQGQDLAHIAVEHNAIAISFNYRLSVFSLFRAPGLETNHEIGDSGNFSILDCLRLLEWVQQNARAFGGDPNLVTLGGYSAGGGYTWALLTSPLAKGRSLFHRAVIQSGPLNDQVYTVEDNYETSRRLLTHYLYENDRSLSFIEASNQATQLHQNGQSGSILRNIAPITLLCLVNRNRANDFVDQCGNLRSLPEQEDSIFNFQPTNDGLVQPLVSQKQALKNSAFEQVPVLLGAAQRESKFFTVGLWLILDESTQQAQGLPTRTQFRTLFNQFDPDNPTVPLPNIGVPTVEFILPNNLTAQTYESSQKVISSLVTRQLTTRGANAVQAHVPIFVYQFRWQNQPPPFDTILGATHTGDLPFWLQTFQEDGNEYQVQPVGFSLKNKSGRIDLAEKMGVYFRNFLRNGDPNVGEIPPRRWTQWRNAIFLKRMHFNASDSRANLVMGR